MSLIYRDKRVENHSNIYKPLLYLRGRLYKGTESEEESVAKRLNNASGQRLCLSTLLSL